MESLALELQTADGRQSSAQITDGILIALKLTEIASRTATLKTLEGVLLSLILSQRNGGRGNNAETGLLDAPELAKRLGVPESWVREQARLGKLPFIRLGHYVRFRLEEVQRYLAERANQAA